MIGPRREFGVVCILLCLSCAPRDPEPESLGPHEFSFPEKTFIAHALGGIEGHNYTNSAEALERSLARGARFFEVDLSFTADGDLVCFHTKHEKHLGIETPITELSTAEFLSHRYDGAFTLMDLETLLQRLAPMPDTYLVTDCKHDFNACMEEVLLTAKSVDPHLVGRIIPQFYAVDQWLDVAKMEDVHGPFATVIFTLYRTEITDDNVVEVASGRSVPVITMSKKRFSQTLVSRLAAEGIDSMIHTVNKPDEIIRYVEKGARGVYSDRFLAWQVVRNAHDRRRAKERRPQ